MKNVSLRFAALIAAMMMTMTMTAQLNDSLSTDSTMWFNQTQELSGVVVKGRLPKTRVKGDAMRTTVAGTILEKAGTVSDAGQSHDAGGQYRFGRGWLKNSSGLTRTITDSLKKSAKVRCKERIN